MWISSITKNNLKEDNIIITYKDFISNIIQSSGQWSRDIKTKYCERHHVIPKCLGGEPLTLTWEEHSNIIWLAAEEHFLAHKRLAMKNTTNNKLVPAFKRMCHSCHCLYNLTAEDYNLIKQQWAKLHSKALLGTKHKQHIIKNLAEYKYIHSIWARRNKNPMYHKDYKITGKKNGCYGKPVEPERLEKIRISNTKYIYYFDNKMFYDWRTLQQYLHSLGYLISQRGIASCIIGTPTIQKKYPTLYLQITKKLKEG